MLRYIHPIWTKYPIHSCPRKYKALLNTSMYILPKCFIFFPLVSLKFFSVLTMKFKKSKLTYLSSSHWATAAQICWRSAEATEQRHTASDAWQSELESPRWWALHHPGITFTTSWINILFLLNIYTISHFFSLFFQIDMLVFFNVF